MTTFALTHEKFIEGINTLPGKDAVLFGQAVACLGILREEIYEDKADEVYENLLTILLDLSPSTFLDLAYDAIEKLFQCSHSLEELQAAYPGKARDLAKTIVTFLVDPDGD